MTGKTRNSLDTLFSGSLPSILVFILTPVLVFTIFHQDDKSFSSTDMNVTTEAVTAESLGREFRHKLDTMEHLHVVSHQTVRFEQVPLSRSDRTLTEEELLPKRVEVRGRIESQMSSNSFEAALYREGDEKPVTRLKLHPPETPGEMPTLYEWHRYPELGTFREETIQADNPWGSDDPAISPPLFAEIPGVCNTAEFWYTWLGGSSEAELFEKIISLGTVFGEEIFNGEQSYRIERFIYRKIDAESGDVLIGKHIYWISKRSRLLIGWYHKNVHVDVSGGFFNFKIVKSTYKYELSTPKDP